MAHNNIGDCLYSLKKKEEALESYKKAIEIDPENPLAIFNCGLAYRSTKQMNNAV
jgi:tetratricopeptide (TPR) repeat protein